MIRRGVAALALVLLAGWPAPAGAQEPNYPEFRNYVVDTAEVVPHDVELRRW